ncbi:MAG TPA: ABC-type transport auxiliary lipoprotein family protein [Methyloceanibacter sp.]|nr:ABC-type transport auxiliary lipoprotein family protein [Methyloceanibacter sp.]
METRARYALIGLFMLAVIAASFAFVYWLENKGGFGQREVYNVRFQGSVSGLLVGSAVLFNGIRVGEVTGLGLNANAPQDVVATITVDRGTPIGSDTAIAIETQGLTGGAAVALRGGSADAPAPEAEAGAPPTLIAAPQAGQDWTQAARDAFQRIDNVLAENSEALHSAITNIDTFADALARNSNRVDGILAGLERMTGGGTSQAEIPVYDLVAAADLPPAPVVPPSWLLVVPEPTTLMGFNTDKILLQPAEGESVPLANARWGDNLPVLFQEKVIQSFENGGYPRSVSRTRDGVEGDFQLLVDIRRFHISTAGEPAAEIEFVAKLLDSSGKIANASTFQATAPAKGSDAKAYVEAMDQAFAKLQAELLKWTTGVLDATPQPPVSVEPTPPDPGQPTHPLL